MIDCKVIYLDMPTSIGGFVKETDGFYDIVLNSRMAYQKNVQTFNEEIYHIENGDISKTDGVDKIETQSHVVSNV